MNRLFQNVENLRKTGQLSVSSTALPVTQIVASAAGVDVPTYTVTTVVNDNAIDLSGVAAGDIIVTADGYKGLVLAIDDGNDTLTLDNNRAWQDSEGKQGRLGGTIKPTDGQAFSVQRISLVQHITIGSAAGNTAVVYIGRHGTATTGDYPLQPGETVPFSDVDFVDVTRIYAITSGTQTINWILGTPSGAGNYAAVIPGSASFNLTWSSLADGDLTPDVSAGTGFVTANTNPTSITDFDGATGKMIFVQAGDADTTIVHDASKIWLQGGIPITLAQGDVMQFVERSGVWYEATIR